MAVSLSRILLFVESRDEADHLASVISAIVETEPTWDRFVRRDGSETDGVAIAFGGQRIEVHVGDQALPAVIELQVQDLAGAGERLLDAGHGYATWPRIGPAERISVTCGDLNVLVTAPADDTEYDVTAERDGSSISVRFTSAPAGGLRIPRRAFLNTGTDLAEQVDSLLRDQPPALRREVLAAATEAAQ